MLDQINMGATILPVAVGYWKGEPESTVVVYSYVDWDKFLKNIDRVREFVHEFGREANQDSVLIEFGSAAIWINKFEE